MNYWMEIIFFFFKNQVSAELKDDFYFLVLKFAKKQYLSWLYSIHLKQT